MRYLLARYLPWLAVIFCGRWAFGFFLLLLQATVIGWRSASEIATRIVEGHENDRSRMRAAKWIRP